MNRKQYALIMVLALVGGLIGGNLSQTLFGSQTALAESKMIYAETIILEDENGNARIRLFAENSFGDAVIEMKGEGDSALYIIMEKKGPHILLSGDKPYIEMNGPNAKLELFGTKAELEVDRIAKGRWTAP